MRVFSFGQEEVVSATPPPTYPRSEDPQRGGSDSRLGSTVASTSGDDATYRWTLNALNSRVRVFTVAARGRPRN